MTCDPRFLPTCLLYLCIFRKIKRSIGAMKYIPTCTSFLFLVRLPSRLFFLCRRPTSANKSSAALSFWPSRLVLSPMYRFQSGHLDARLLIWETQRLIRRFHCSGMAPCVLKMLVDWAISLTHSLTWLSIHCVVKPPFSCQIPIVSTAHSPTPTLAFSAQMRTCRFSIRILLAFVTTHFGNQKASRYTLGSHQCSMIMWWMSNACYTKKPLGVLNISLRVMRCCGRGKEGLSNMLEIVSKVGKQRKYIYVLAGFSWSSDIILAAIQLGDILPTII